MSELFEKVCEVVARENEKILSQTSPLPCPFCGEELKKRGDWPLYDHDNPGCVMDGSTLSEAHISQWNVRA